jgi:hypothetical protein
MKWIYLIKAIVYFVGCLFISDDIKINLAGLFLGMMMFVFFIVDSITENIDELNKDKNI